MAVLITGGTGVIGAEVARLLLDQGEERVVLFDRSPSTKRLGDAAERVEVIRGDLGLFSHVLDAVQTTQPTAIYHLGAMLSLLCEADPPAAIQSNAMGTFHVLEAARLFAVPQVLFASSIGTYRDDLGDGPLDDTTLQRPTLLYGAIKVFGELLGRFYRRKYGLDFRGLRYPVIVAPGVTTPGVLQYPSWVIEAAATGTPFTITVEPRTCPPLLYVKDAARAMIELAAAPMDRIRTINYLVTGMEPVPTAGEWAELVRDRVPGAQIDFAPDAQLQALLDEMVRPIDDRNARNEWGWRPAYGLEAMVDDFLRELRERPQRYTA
jgi:threonine 3-dehydrogenase